MLGPVLSKLMSPFQFGFIPGKQISQCISLASEGFNYLNKSGKKGGIAFKIDIRKAFDTVNWDFLIIACNLMGFCDNFVNYLHVILGSSKLSILINGTPKGYFACSQGVRQGGPLSHCSSVWLRRSWASGLTIAFLGIVWYKLYLVKSLSSPFSFLC